MSEEFKFIIVGAGFREARLPARLTEVSEYSIASARGTFPYQSSWLPFGYAKTIEDPHANWRLSNGVRLPL